MEGSPEVAPEVTVFDLLGGEAGVRALVDAFYDHMDHDADFAGLRAMHPETTAGSRDKLYWFLCGWTGGPDHFVQRFGHPRLRARHMPFAIGQSERDQWMHCMVRAMEDRELEPALRNRLISALFETADWMRNREG